MPLKGRNRDPEQADRKDVRSPKIRILLQEKQQHSQQRRLLLLLLLHKSRAPFTNRWCESATWGNPSGTTTLSLSALGAAACPTCTRLKRSATRLGDRRAPSTCAHNASVAAAAASPRRRIAVVAVAIVVAVVVGTTGVGGGEQPRHQRPHVCSKSHHFSPAAAAA